MEIGLRIDYLKNKGDRGFFRENDLNQRR